MHHSAAVREAQLEQTEHGLLPAGGGAGVEVETNDADEAYARFPELEPKRYGGWLPDGDL
jgi:hypothetical protein